MNKFYLSFFLLLLSLPGLASHIVGGELELIHKRSYTYQIRLKMYVDAHNAMGTVIADEVAAFIGIFDKQTNVKLQTVRANRRSNVPVEYGELCDNSPLHHLNTRMLTFYEDVYLDPAIYNKPTGYYLAWENCCRNIIIENIVNPSNEGMVFYLEFSPVIKNGVRFYNSSPQFPQIVGDYPCVNKPFRFDFSGTDFNDDSLVYYPSTPIAGHGVFGGSPDPMPAPYDSVQWEWGYGVNNQIPGTPPFGINRETGEIFFTPLNEGLFVFGVTIDEYRNGVKIGSVRRDFQLLVTDCEPNAPASIDLELPGGTKYNELTDTIVLNLERDTCFSILVADSNTIKFGDAENLAIQVINRELPRNVLTVSTVLTVTPGADTLTTNLCFDACNKLFIEKDTLFHIEIVVTDAPKCPRSLATYDTLNIVIKYKPQINTPPTIVTSPVILTDLHVTVGKQITFDVIGEDDDNGDIVTVTGSGDGFDFSDKGMIFHNVTGPDSVGSRFRWTPMCGDVDPGNYRLRFVVDDNSCKPTNRDTIYINVQVQDTVTAIAGISPSNLFTPNNDELNDYFEIRDMPEGNCDYFFRKITIYNRWGAKVYESDKRDFKWDGEKNPPGVYYYTIDLNKKEYKGWVEIVR